MDDIASKWIFPNRQSAFGWSNNRPRYGKRSNWRSTSARKWRSRFAILDAYLSMHDEQRHHYNMKHGFAGDEPRTDASAGTLYDDVPEETKKMLRNGFDSQIGRLFGGENVTEADLRRNSGWSELRPVVRQLLAQLR